MKEYTPTPEFIRRRSNRNKAMLWSLIALVVLFYVTSMVRVHTGS